MNKIVCLMALFFVAFVTMNSKKASAKECYVYAGGGGERVFPVWKVDHKIMVIPYGETASIWLPDSCKSGTGTSGIESSKELIEVTEEETSTFAKGRRIYFTAKPGKGIKSTKVIVNTPSGSFTFEVKLGPTYDEAATATAELTKDIASLRKETGELRTGLVNVKARTEAGVDLGFSYLGAVFNHTRNHGMGSGIQVGIFGTLKKWDDISLRLGGVARFNSLVVTYANSTNYLNKDGSYFEWDIAVPLQFQWAKVLRGEKWVGGLSIEIEFGPMLRVTNAWDSIMDMDPQNDLLVVEGRRDTVFGLTAGIGLSFFFTRHVGVKGQFIWSGATQQVVHPGTRPARVEEWVNSLYFTGGLIITF